MDLGTQDERVWIDSLQAKLGELLSDSKELEESDQKSTDLTSNRIFISGHPTYGTRAQTIVLRTRANIYYYYRSTDSGPQGEWMCFVVPRPQPEPEPQASSSYVKILLVIVALFVLSGLFK